MNKVEHNKKALIPALEKSLGVVTTACKQVGIGRTTFYNYYNSDKDFAKQVDEVENAALDFAESKLHNLIEEGNPSATIFFLKTKGKGRGYIEKSQLDLTSSEPVKIDINIEGVKY